MRLRVRVYVSNTGHLHLDGRGVVWSIRRRRRLCEYNVNEWVGASLGGSVLTVNETKLRSHDLRYHFLAATKASIALDWIHALTSES